MKIGITGGIGSGKSYVCRRLTAQYGIVVYDCDDAAKRLIRTSPVIRQEPRSLSVPTPMLTDNSTKQPWHNSCCRVRTMPRLSTPLSILPSSATFRRVV